MDLRPNPEGHRHLFFPMQKDLFDSYEAVTDGLCFHAATYNWYFNNFKAEGLKSGKEKKKERKKK